MSDVAVIDPPETFADKAIPLLKEYLKKMCDIRTQVHESRDFWQSAPTGSEKTRNRDLRIDEYNSLFWYFNSIEPAIRDFGQQVSGMVDQGRISPLTRSELRMRLAELEGVIEQVRRLFTAYRPT